MAANCSSDLFTQFINVGIPRKIHRYIFQVISQEKLVQSEHYQWKARVYEIEYLIFAYFRLGSIFNLTGQVHSSIWHISRCTHM